MDLHTFIYLLINLSVINLFPLVFQVKNFILIMTEYSEHCKKGLASKTSITSVNINYKRSNINILARRGCS